MFLYRARPVGQNPDMNMAAQLKAKQAAGQPLTWYQKNLLNPQTNPELLAREKYYGQWFEKDPNRLDWYIDPATRNFRDDDVIEILRTRLPKTEADKLNVSQFDDAKILSASPETEFILPKDVVNSAERFSASDLQQLIQEDKAFNTPHWWRGYKPIDNPNLKNTSAPVKAGANAGMDMSKHQIKNVNYYQQLLDKGPYNAGQRKYIQDVINSVKKQDGLATQRQLNYLNRLKTGNFNFGPKGYAQGGKIEVEREYEEKELTPEMIQWYKDQGFEVEESED